MSHIHKGQLTASGEWAKHLRPPGRQEFWGGERAAERSLIRRELEEYHDQELPSVQQAEKPENVTKASET